MANYERQRRVQRHRYPPPQHLFCPQPQQLGPHYGGPTSGIWCERCRRAGHEAKMCAPRIPRSPPQYSGSYCYRAKPFVLHYSGGDGIALSPQQQIRYPPPQHLFCPQPQQLGPHYGGPASGIWCERCGRAGHEAKMCAAREPRRFNVLCGTCSVLVHLSCHCLLQRDHIYSDVSTLSSPSQINRSGRGGTGYDLPMSPPSYSGRSGGTGYDIPSSTPKYSGCNNGYGTNEGPQQQYGRGADDSAGYGATFAQQQPAPRPFRSFGWDQRYACRNGPPVNGGLSNSIAQGQAQRDVSVDDQEEGQRPSKEVEYHGGPLSEVIGPPESVEQHRATTEVDCHGGPVPKVSGPPGATASLERGGLPLQARHQ